MSYIELQEENETLKQQIKEYESKMNEITYISFIVIPLSIVGIAFIVNYFIKKKKED